MKKIFTLFLLFAFAKTAFSQFSNPMDFSLFPYTLNGKEWGYCDKDRNVIIPPRYDSAPFFQTIDKTVLAVVGIQKKYGLIDKAGKEILPLEYDEIQFCDTLLILHQKNKQWLVNIYGKFVQDCSRKPPCLHRYEPAYCGGEFYNPLPFRLNYATSEPPRTENNDTEKFNVYKTFYITEKNSDRKHTNVLYRLNKREQGDSATRVHYEQEFEWSIWKDWVWAIRNDILWKNNQYALKSRQLTDIKIDSQKWTKTIEFTTYQTPFQYDSIKQVGSCFFIKKDKKIGVFSNKAAQIIPIEYDTIIKTEIGFIVRKDKMYGTVDENGKSILPLEYDFIDTKITQIEHSYKLKAKKNGLWGVYDIHFPRVVLPHIYKKIDFLAPCFIKATLPNDAVFYIIYKSKKQQCYQEMYPNGLCHKPQPLK